MSEAESELLEEWWASYTDISQEVQQQLADWKIRTLRGDHQAVRNEVRNFYTNSFGSFNLLMLSLLSVPEFYSDIESALGPEEREELEELEDKYQDTLSDVFRVVYREENNGHENMITDTSYELQLPIGERTPLITLEMLSGYRTIADVTSPPQHFLDLAHSFTEVVDDTLEESLEEEKKLSEQDLEEIRGNYKLLSRVVEDLGERLEEFEE